MIQLTVSQTALSDVQGGALSKISCLLDKMLAGTRAGSDKHSSKTTIVSNCQARKRGKQYQNGEEQWGEAYYEGGS